jgi:hypothetical protein
MTDVTDREGDHILADEIHERILKPGRLQILIHHQLLAAVLDDGEAVFAVIHEGPVHGCGTDGLAVLVHDRHRLIRGDQVAAFDAARRQAGA